MAEIATPTGPAPLRLPDELTGEITEAQAWLVRVVNEIETGGNPAGLFTHDPIRDIETLNDRLHRGLNSAGVTIPPIRGMVEDPLGNLLDWRDFLANLVTVH